MGQVPKMSESELEVMRGVWAAGGAATSPALHRALSRTRDWKLNTVLTFLSRLSAKGLIRVEKQGRGRPSLYVAAMTEAEYKRAETRDFLGQVHGGSVGSLMTALCGEDTPSAQVLAELRAWFLDQEGQA